MTFELPPEDKWCHCAGFERKCRDFVIGFHEKKADGDVVFHGPRCKRWRNLPGVDVFSGVPREQWGCIDDLVLQLQGESNRENKGTHTAITEFREMVINPDYRARQLSQPAPKLIEGST